MDKLAEKLLAEILEITLQGAFTVLTYGIDSSKPQQIIVATTGPRRLGIDIQALTKHVGKPIHPGMHLVAASLEKFVRLNPAVKLSSISIPEFNSKEVDHLKLLGEVISQFAPSHWKARGFALMDICEFSTMPASVQVSLRLTLATALRKARMSLMQQTTATDLNFESISTGDGYYFWNALPGPNRDVLTFAMLVLALTQIRAIEGPEIDFEVRAAFGIGEAYTIPYLNVWESIARKAVFRDAIGPILNELARLVAAARPSQLLVRNFSLLGLVDGAEYVDPSTMAQVAQRLLCQKCPAVGSTVVDLVPPELLRVVDKHGDTYHCFNVAGQSFYFTGATPRVQRYGLQHDGTRLLDGLAFKRG